MIQDTKEDSDGNNSMEFDLDGIKYMIRGLEHLANSPVGTELSTPAVWSVPAPWWRFWNRSDTPVAGEFRLRRVG